MTAVNDLQRPAPSSSPRPYPPSSSKHSTRPRRTRITRLLLLSILLPAAAFGSWAKGRGYKTMVIRLVRTGTMAAPRPAAHPAVVESQPADGDDNVLPESAVTAQLNLPTGRLNRATVSGRSVTLSRTDDNAPVAATVAVSPRGGRIILRPAAPLEPNTGYTFRIGAGITDVSGSAVAPHTLSFSTSATGGKPDPSLRFEKVALPGTAGAGAGFTCVQVFGAEHRLYASADDGRVFRFAIEADGALGPPQVITALQSASGGARLVSGFCFDPASTAAEPILWVAHSHYAFENAPDWSGRVSRMSGPDLAVVQDIVVNLPRSYRDHLTNQPSFGPDGALYFAQGCNSTYGAPDAVWGNRTEHLLNATVLRLDVTKVTPGHPIDAKTPDAGGQYDPSAAGAPLTIYCCGVRNAFDLLWHSNGRLYVPNNGSSPGGNTPAGGGAPAITGVAVSEDDWLYNVAPGKYYGHPNPRQGHFVLNGGNPAGAGAARSPARVPQYPAGTRPDPDWEPGIYNFGKHVSPDGLIEYRGDALDGKLDHKILVCRYNVGGDIIVLGLGADGNVNFAQTGIPGLTGFANPLDLAEDLRTGYLYVCEYGSQRITLLRPAPAATPGG